jgi:hypothetical protein
VDKNKVIDEILSGFQARLSGLPEERERALTKTSPEDRPAMEQAFARQQRDIEAVLQQLLRLEPTARRRHTTVSEGSLLQVLQMGSTFRKKQWWMVLSCACEQVSTVTVDGEQVFIRGSELFSQTLLGRKAGGRIWTPPDYGDLRDESTSVTVLLRKVL